MILGSIPDMSVEDHAKTSVFFDRNHFNSIFSYRGRFAPIRRVRSGGDEGSPRTTPALIRSYCRDFLIRWVSKSLGSRQTLIAIDQHSSSASYPQESLH